MASRAYLEQELVEIMPGKTILGFLTLDDKLKKRGSRKYSQWHALCLADCYFGFMDKELKMFEKLDIHQDLVNVKTCAETDR